MLIIYAWLQILEIFDIILTINLVDDNFLVYFCIRWDFSLVLGIPIFSISRSN